VTDSLPHLRFPILATFAGIVAERLVRAFWPVWTILFFMLAPLLLGVHDDMPLELVWTIAVAGLIGIAVFTWRGWWRFRWPLRAEALARVDARLPGRPISALGDAQAVGAGDPASEAVWSAHLQRMQDRTKAARYVSPDLRLAQADPFGLRYIALLFLMVGVLFGSVTRVGTVAQASPVGSATTTATGPTWEGWIEPPAYTGKPTLYLPDLGEDRIEVPEGSRFTVRFYGDIGALTLSETVSGRRADELPPASDQHQVFEALQQGALRIDGSGGQAWDVSIVTDGMPSVELTGPALSNAEGQMTLPFRAADDYGVTGGSATVAIDLAQIDRRHGLAIDPDPIAPLIVDLPIPITGDRAAFDEALIDNFSQSVMANLPVKVRLEVTDAKGQTGQSAETQMVLPGRRFFQPVARAIIEQRRDLLWSTANAPRVAQLLRAISNRPDGFFRNEAHFPMVRGVVETLEAKYEGGLTDEERDEVAALMWELAIEFEEGALADARERLQRAQDRLAEAMRNGASAAEIQELMDELRDATNDYMQMLADQMDPNEDSTDQPDGGGETMQFTQDELNALMDRIQELMEEGRMAEAAVLMEQLNQLMENMKMTQGEGQGGPRSPGQKSMEDLGETLRDQQQLSDDAFRDLQDQFNGGQQETEQRPGETPRDGDGTNGDPGQRNLADRQEALRQMLEEQRRNLPNLSGDEAEAARRAIEQAERSMDRAEDALRRGDMAEAIDRQAEAMDALREGLRELGRAIAQSERDESGQGQQQGDQTAQAAPRQSDPLGRQLGTEGQSGTDQNLLQGEDIYRRAGELLDEIRRRSAELDRPEDERNYLRRLLDRF
jgi:uncharacterized protein (TIGR02302 family)